MEHKRCLSCKHQGLILTTEHLNKKLSMIVYVCNNPREADRRVSGGCWPVSLAKLMCFVNERLPKNMVGSDKGRHPSTHGLYTHARTHTHTFFKHSQRDHTQKTTEAAQGQSRELVPCSMEKFYSTLGLPVDAFQG